MNSHNERVYKMSFAGVYPHYIQKAEKKGRTKAEVDEIIFWLTGYNAKSLQQHIDRKTNFEDFSAKHHRLIRMYQKLPELYVGTG